MKISIRNFLATLILFCLLVSGAFAAGGFGAGNNLTGFWQQKLEEEAGITLVGTAENTAQDGGSVTVTFPGGVLENDVVYAVWLSASNDGDLAMAPTSAGWTELAELFGNDASDANFAVYRKVMGVSPDSSFQTTAIGDAGSSNAVSLYVLRGVNTTTPEDVARTTATGTNTHMPDNPSITPVTNNAWVLAAGGGAYTGTVDTWTGPAGYNDVLSPQGVDSGGQGPALLSWKLIPTAAAEDPAAYTASGAAEAGGAWAAVTIAVRPQ